MAWADESTTQEPFFFYVDFVGVASIDHLGFDALRALPACTVDRVARLRGDALALRVGVTACEAGSQRHEYRRHVDIYRADPVVGIFRQGVAVGARRHGAQLQDA